MKPRPLHRSLTLWSGILVMIFTVWAWKDSRGIHSTLNIQTLRLENATAGFAISREPAMSFSPTWMRRDYAWSSWVDWFARPFFLRGQGMHLNAAEPRDDVQTVYEADQFTYHYAPPELWKLFIPHWLILLAVALPWGGLLLWRSRRIKKAESAAPRLPIGAR